MKRLSSFVTNVIAIAILCTLASASQVGAEEARWKPSTKVDLKAETVTVGFDADRATVSTLARTITEAGFPATAKTHGG